MLSRYRDWKAPKGLLEHFKPEDVVEDDVMTKEVYENTISSFHAFCVQNVSPNIEEEDMDYSNKIVDIMAAKEGDQYLFSQVDFSI